MVVTSNRRNHSLSDPDKNKNKNSARAPILTPAKFTEKQQLGFPFFLALHTLIPRRRQVCKDPSKRASGKKAKRRLARDPASGKEESAEIDYEKKILHMSWHPQDDIIAVAGNDKLYIYAAQR